MANDRTDYIALIRKEPDSDFGISFPDLPGCVSAVGSLDEAPAAAAEALTLHLEGLAEDGAEPPAPSKLEAIMAKRTNRDAAVIVVPAPKLKTKVVRVNVTLPEDLLADIDRSAGTGNRSGFLAKAARALLTGSAPVGHERIKPAKAAASKPRAKRKGRKSA